MYCVLDGCVRAQWVGAQWVFGLIVCMAGYVVQHTNVPKVLRTLSTCVLSLGQYKVPYIFVEALCRTLLLIEPGSVMVR